MKVLYQIFDANGFLRFGEVSETLSEARSEISKQWDMDTSAVAVIVERVPGGGWDEMVRVHVSQNGDNWNRVIVDAA